MDTKTPPGARFPTGLLLSWPTEAMDLSEIPKNVTKIPQWVVHPSPQVGAVRENRAQNFILQ